MKNQNYIKVSSFDIENENLKSKTEYQDKNLLQNILDLL